LKATDEKIRIRIHFSVSGSKFSVVDPDPVRSKYFFAGSGFGSGKIIQDPGSPDPE
jgi:hypothetical protein